MLAGEPPFKADNALKLMLRITKENPRKLTMANRKVRVTSKPWSTNASRKTRAPLSQRPRAGCRHQHLPRRRQARAHHAIAHETVITAAKANRARIIPTTAAIIAIGIVSIVARSMFNTRDAGPLVEQGIPRSKKIRRTTTRSSKSLSGFSRTPSRWSPKWQSLPGSGTSLARRGIDKNTHRVLNPKFVEEAFKANEYASRLDPKLELESIACAANYYTGWAATC